MARDMRCDQDFLAEIVPDKAKGIGNFVCYVRGQTPKPVHIALPFGTIGKLPKMSDAAYAKLMERSHNEISISEVWEPEKPKPKPKRPPPSEADPTALLRLRCSAIRLAAQAKERLWSLPLQSND